MAGTRWESTLRTGCSQPKRRSRRGCFWSQRDVGRLAKTEIKVLIPRKPTVSDGESSFLKVLVALGRKIVGL